MKLTKVSSTILKGKNIGTGAVTRGNPVRFIAIPRGMTGSSLSFSGSIDGIVKFDLRDSNLAILAYSTDISPAPVSSFRELEDGGLIIPFGEAERGRGVMMIQAVSDKPQTQDQAVDFYYEVDND